MKIRAYADLHLFFNRDDISRYIIELNKIKEDLILAPVDMLVFCGDLLDKAFNMDDEIIPYTFDFVSDIIKICEDKGIIFRVIKGTSSHDAKITETLNSVYKNHPLVRFIPKPEIENIRILNNTYSVKWLPETYGNSDEYNELKSSILMKNTDMCFFHGSVKSIYNGLFNKDNHDIKPTTLPKSYIWDDEILLSRTKYFCAGGHIHKSLDVQEKIFYINSYTSMNFNDAHHINKKDLSDNIKGYMEFDINGNSFIFKRIKNNLAPNFFNIDIYDIHEKEKYEIEEYIKGIISSIPFNSRLKIRVHGDISINTNINISEIKKILKNYKIVIDSSKLKITNINKRRENDIDVNDVNISIPEKIQKIYQEVYGDITLKEIEDIIHDVE